MRDRQSVIGFTEAELGLVLALVALALWVIAEAKALPATAHARTVISVAQKRALQDSARMYRRSIAVQDSLQRTVVELKRRSNQTPTCFELKYPERYIASVMVLGPGQFEIDGERVNFSGLMARLAHPQEFALKNRCRHAVHVTGAPGLTVEQYTPGLRAIRARFNTDIR